MKFLQKLGKALMLPVAVLPICGILMGIGYWLCPATMQGGEIQGVANLIGLFLVKAGGALIDNMAILFAIGVGVGMSEKNDGTGGIAALASWLMLTTLLSTGFVTTIMPSIAEDATKTLAFNKIANPFIGIIAGIIGSMCYNKFKDTKLPDWLSFFSGKRCVAIIAGVVSILASVVLLFVWPLLFGGLVALGEAIVGLDVVGAGIYAFLNRLLIPTGLHNPTPAPPPSLSSATLPLPPQEHPQQSSMKRGRSSTSTGRGATSCCWGCWSRCRGACGATAAGWRRRAR